MVQGHIANRLQRVKCVNFESTIIEQIQESNEML